MQDTITIESERNLLLFLVEMIVLCFLTLGALHCAILDDHVSKLIPMFEKESDLKISRDVTIKHLWNYLE